MSPSSIVSFNGAGPARFEWLQSDDCRTQQRGAANLLTLGGATLTISQTSSTAPSFFGTMSGAGNLVKTGSGTQSLFGPSTYTGTTHRRRRIFADQRLDARRGQRRVAQRRFPGNCRRHELILPRPSRPAPIPALIPSGGRGTTTLAGTVAFGGSTSPVTGGGLTIDDTANNAVKLSASPALTLTPARWPCSATAAPTPRRPSAEPISSAPERSTSRAGTTRMPR